MALAQARHKTSTTADWTESFVMLMKMQRYKYLSPIYSSYCFMWLSSLADTYPPSSTLTLLFLLQQKEEQNTTLAFSVYLLA